MSYIPQKKPARSNLTKLTEETIRAKAKSGDTPLHRAARKGQFDLVPSHLFSLELFLVANNCGDTPLHLAARHGHLNQVPIEFLNHKTHTCRRTPPGTPNGTYFTQWGKEVHTSTVLHVAARCNHTEQIPREFLTLPYLGLTANGFEKTLLEYIYENGQLNLIPDINSNKEIWSLKNGYGQTLEDVIAANLAAKKEREVYIAEVRSEPITEKQKAKLRWFDYPVTKGMTKGEAHDAIDECIRQNPEKEKEYQNRPATAEQWKELHKLGHRDKTPLTYSEARNAIDEVEFGERMEGFRRYLDGGQFMIDYLDNFVNNGDTREDLGYKKLNRKQLKELSDHLKLHPEFENAGTYKLAEIALQLFPENRKVARDRFQRSGKRHKPFSSVVSWVLFLTVCAVAYNRCSSTPSRSPDSKATTVPPSAEIRSTTPVPNTLAKPPLTPAPSSANPAVVAEAKRRAVQRYPALGVANSPLNTAFVARYKRYQIERPELFNDPEWPMKLAIECADALQVK